MRGPDRAAPRPAFRGSRGFTMIELLIVMCIIAILTAIAIPSYREYVRRSNRSDAIIALTELANLEEKHYSNELAYTTTISDLGYDNFSPDGHYSLTIGNSANVDYILTATAASSSQKDDAPCQEFTLNSFGQRGAENGDGDDTSNECWNRR